MVNGCRAFRPICDGSTGSTIISTACTRPVTICDMVGSKIKPISFSLGAILIAFISLFSVQRRAYALTVSEETDYSSTQIYQTLNASGDFVKTKATTAPQAAKKANGNTDDVDDDGALTDDDDDDDNDESPFNWVLSYSYNQISTPNGDQSAIIDTTSKYGFGLGWSGESEYSVNGKLSYASTPAESLSARGALLNGSYRFVYKGSGADVFEPYLLFKILTSTTDYVETYSSEIPRKKSAPKKVSGTSELWQQMIGLDLTVRPGKTWENRRRARSIRLQQRRRRLSEPT